MARYIDADAAKIDAEERGGTLWLTDGDVKEVKRFLDDQPTADVAPVIHAHHGAKMDEMIDKTFQNDANEEDDVSLTITCTMRKDCMRKFLSFLARIEYDGSIGHSEVIAFFADGDGTFRPKFVADEPVRRAHWIDSPNIMECVVCSNCFSDDLSAQVVAPPPADYKFCPSCGAKMDEEVKDDAVH